ncbi:MAG: cation:proton antiporter [Pseudomonadota bacterium]
MTDFLLLAFTFLIAGVIAVPIATRLGLGSVLGYLIAGIIIAPLLAALGVDVVSIQHFAEFGVVMMLFLVGLELEPKRLWEMRGTLAGLGLGHIVMTTVAVTGLAMLFGIEWHFALTLGLIFSLSSTAIVLQTHQEKGLMRTEGGQASFAALLTEDVAVIPMLALLPLLAVPELIELAGDVGHGGDHGGDHGSDHGDDHGGGHGDGHGDGHGASMSLVSGLNGWQTALVSIGAIGAVILGGSYLTRPLFRFISQAGLRELFTATALMLVVGIALLMGLVGLSAALGTFLAGVVLANSEYRHELESDIDPFRGLLLGLFFMTVGASIDFGLLFEALPLYLALTLLVMFIKFAVLFSLGTLIGIRGTDRWLLALSLAQAGEFGFVLLSFATANLILPGPLADQALLVVALSMLFTPLLFIFYERVIVPRNVSDQTREADEIEEPGEVLVCGRGRVGGIVEAMVSAAGYKTTIVDYNSKQIANLMKFGIKTYYGDATRPDLLHAAGIERAKIIVVAVDEEESINTIVRHVVEYHPHVHIIARARNRHHVYVLWSLGCRDIIRETYDSSLRMGRSAFEALGYERDLADEMVDIYNAADRSAMIEVADLFDVNIPAAENEPYIAKVRELLETRSTELAQEMDEARKRRA